MSFRITCNFCSKTFVTTRALFKHCVQKHYLRSAEEIGDVRFFEGDSAEMAVLPVARRMSHVSDAYLKWLACVTERINGCHHPKFEGRWFRVDVFQAPTMFFQHMLSKLATHIHGVKKMRHMKHPMILGMTKRFSYKVYDEDIVWELLEEQKEIPICKSAAFDGNHRPVEEDPYAIDDPIEALRAAERRATNQKRSSRPKVRSSIVIGEGEGRATREFEFQWWPELYKTDFGKLTLRFYVDKVHL